MNSESPNSATVSIRCSHRTTKGRQCRQLAADSRSCLCAHHRGLQKQKEIYDLSDDLLARSQNFQTAQGVNFALANIYRLLAANRISPRRASVLAYVNSLLLRPLPAIDYDQENGHTDPTADEEDETEEDETEEEETEQDETEQGSSVRLDEAASAATAPSSNAHVNPAPAWDSSIPEPDPTKKPS
ncbi:MAG: hypothetical protein WBE13_01240 [Candidatus Acidiferrum sp.]